MTPASNNKAGTPHGSPPDPTASPDSAPQADVERQLRAQLAALTGGLAPDDYLEAWWQWYLNVATQPPRQAQLAQSAYEKLLDTWQFAAQAASGSPLAPERETQGFSDAAWNVWPFNVYARTYANWATWWQQALAPSAADPKLARAGFAGRLLLEAASPANFLHTNPELLNKTAAESGQNLIRGLKNWLEDAQRLGSGARAPGTERFEVGKDVAITPGKVVFRNRLIELLQYSPQTPDVYAEPVLITPAWIMKYYILDLSPRNSLVRFLVEKGHTVFMISWKNPGAADRDLGLDDYVQLGFLDALAEVRRRVPRQPVHAVGYCIGGTLLAIAAARLAAAGDTSLASLTLLAAQTDFSEPGELSVFITPSQIAMLEAMMNKSGVLESERMGGAFALLRSRDLMWAPAVNQYVRGERPQLNDLMAWNADGTRMPWRMHSEYLERLYLKNELARGVFTQRRAAGGPGRGTAADVRGRHRDRSRGAVALGLQDPRPDAQHRLHVPADQRRPQCRHRQRAGAPQAPPSPAHLEQRHRYAHAGRLAAARPAARGLVVAGVAALAWRALDRAARGGARRGRQRCRCRRARGCARALRARVARRRPAHACDARREWA